MQQTRHVHKFGGSSLADPNCFRRVADIISKHSADKDLIVVSAAGKTTNRLIEIIEYATEGDTAAAQALASLSEFQRNLATELLSGSFQQQALNDLDQDLTQLALMLENGLDQYINNQILSFGEVWSARLLSIYLRQQGLAASWLDSRKYLSAEFGVQPVVDIELSREKLTQELLGRENERVVITGFFAADEQGHTVTLGRNGSDYSATVTGAIANAVSTTIWSDVAGVFSTDPRKVKSAVLLERLSLDEAAELSRLGSPVLHARTLSPVIASSQKLSLRSSYTPDEGSTQIVRRQHKLGAAKIVHGLEQACLIEITLPEGANLSDSYAPLADYLSAHYVSPLVINKDAKAHTLRLVYTPEVANSAHQVLQQYSHITDFSAVELKTGYSMVGLVGNGVSDNAEQCYRFYRALSDQPLEFIQACDKKLSLVAVTKEILLEPLLQTLHETLFKRAKRIGLVLFGNGNIGSAWLKLLTAEQSKLEQRFHQKLTLCGVFNHLGGKLNFDGLMPQDFQAGFEPEPFIWEELLSKLKHHPFDELVILDITASESLSRYYPEFAARHLHLITANKYAGSAEISFYNEVKQSFSDHGCHWLYNATVGAGLPVQSSIAMLQGAGDHIQGISGIFSGTLSWLFQQYDGSMPFSELLDQAWQQGLTEPDPREDLSGNDVMRKLLILAREAGLKMEAKDIELSSLVPDELAKMSADEFMQNTHLLDETLAEKLEKAQKQGKVLRYIARFSVNGKATVSLEALSETHAFANLLPCDNVFAIETQWYRTNPLTVQGPGAGREVTAGAIQADLVSLCEKL
ncbi:bifunctional aspartate kinase/homoserine dehydrogenase II [Motilimonas pumila]|uniref:Bifunctional aspartokinase/homoserine dehydrogenase n=1 Tax=Motilimonas pumila TaxID=2303987 RepID=A0A418YHV1_9GAMM|nr:bifunctional aspartate kinase/homoserine dehydrogenase II [Motilimonas pumila]RJG49958.1 bifunctional aspartate kinase/homoserine dehydrogenase II [Motilimonas pumila]